MSRQQNENVFWSKLFVLIGVLAFIPFFLLCRYVFPINDDFSFALQHMGVNCFMSVVEGWQNWSGRFFATFISSLNPFVISDTPLETYRWFSFGVVCLTLMIFFLSFSLGVKNILKRWEGLGLGALMMLIYLTYFPSVSQAFYWFSSYTAYTIPSLLYLMLLALICRNDTVSYIFACMLAFIVPGGNEVTAVITVCTLTYLAIVYRNPKIYGLTVIALISIIIVILSPGNGIRMEHQLSAHPYLWTFVVSIVQSLSWIFLWGPILLIATVIYIPLYGQRLSQLPVFNVKLKFYIVALFLSVLLAHIPPTLGLSSVIVDRTANCLLIFIIPAYFYGVNILIRKYPKILVFSSQLFSSKKIYAAGVFCFLFIGPLSIDSPVTTAVTDLITAKAADYAYIQAERIEIAQSAPSNEIVELPPLGLTSESLYVKELDSIPSGEFSTNFCKVYGSEASVYVTPESVVFEDNFTSLKNFNKRVRGSQIPK